jgi:hypothetical protein
MNTRIHPMWELGGKRTLESGVLQSIWGGGEFLLPMPTPPRLYSYGTYIRPTLRLQGLKAVIDDWMCGAPLSPDGLTLSSYSKPYKREASQLGRRVTSHNTLNNHSHAQAHVVTLVIPTIIHHPRI